MNNEIKFNVPMKYKDICAMFVCEEKKDTRAKQRQLKEWNKKFVVTKDKTWYTIVRPLNEAELEIVNNEDTFVANIERILLHEIKNQKCNYQVVLTTKELFEKLKLVNDKYYKAKFKEFNNYLNEFLDENKTLFGYNGNYENKSHAKRQAENELKTYFHETNSLLKTTVFDCLNSLQKYNLIIYSKSFKLTTKVTFKSVTGEETSCIQTYITTTEEDSEILEIIDDVKKEMGKNPKDSIHFFTSSEKREYYDKIDEKVKERFGYDHCHEATRIILSKKAIKRDLDRIEVIINSMKSNNDKAVEKLNKSKVLNDKMSTKRVECFTEKLIKIHGK